MIDRSILTSLAFFAAVAGANAQLNSRVIQGPKVEIDQITTPLVSTGSTLHYRYIVINDDSCPLEIANAGISGKTHGLSGFVLKADGTAKARIGTVLGFRISFRLYDAFGYQFREPDDTYLTDLPVGKEWKLDRLYDWSSQREEVSKLLFVATYVSEVRYRRSDGTEFVWHSHQPGARALADAEIAKLNLVERSNAK